MRALHSLAVIFLVMGIVSIVFGLVDLFWVGGTL